MDIEELKSRARDYVEGQADTEVLSVEFSESFRLLGRDDAVMSVVTSIILQIRRSLFLEEESVIVVFKDNYPFQQRNFKRKP